MEVLLFISCRCDNNGSKGQTCLEPGSPCWEVRLGSFIRRSPRQAGFRSCEKLVVSSDLKGMSYFK